MNSIEKDSLIIKSLCGVPYLFGDVCAIFPATLREIAEVGYDNFLFYTNLILAKKPMDCSKEVHELIDPLSELEYMLLMAMTDSKMNSKLKEAFRFFTHEEIIFSFDPPQIIVGTPEEKRSLNEENFAEFRKIIKIMFFMTKEDDDDIEITEKDNPIVAAMKRKMLENKEKLAKAKRKKMSDGEEMTFSDLIASVTIAQCDLNISNIWDITYYAFNDQLKRMGWRDRFNINNRAALAGAKIDKKDLQHWMRPINSKDKK